MLQDNVLLYLEENRGKIITGGEIARGLGVSRTAVWKAVHTLRDRGHEIVSLANSGYQLQHSSDGLSVNDITSGLTTEKFGRKIELYQTIASTNTYMKKLDHSDYPEGFTVIADHQTAGRGRFARKFYSPDKQGIYLSLLLKPNIDLPSISVLTICAAIAVCRGVLKICDINAGIKWVNDIYIGGKKLCGILSEASMSAELQSIDSVVVGIGINTGVVDDNVREIAASILEESGKRGIRNRLIAEVLNQFEDIYFGLDRGDKKKDIIAEYSQKLLFVGKEIRVTQHEKSYSAIVQGVDETGALIVCLSDGSISSITSGEINLDWRSGQ